MKNFEQLTTTELTTINGGGPLDFLTGPLGGLIGVLGSTGGNAGGPSTGTGNAMTLIGAGTGSLLNNAGNSLFALSNGGAAFLSHVTLPGLPL
jgi:bacteriocin-like protein